MVHLDFETYSRIDLRNCGLYRYAEDESTEVLIIGYAFDDEPVEIWRTDQDLFELPPPELIDRIQHGDEVCAHNAQFERAIWHWCLHKRHGWPDIKLKQWFCTAAQAAALALPRNLDGAAGAVELDARKDPRGYKLIRTFCIPRRATKNNPKTRIMPQDQPDDFNDFVEYCRQDVVTERAFKARVPALTRNERIVWQFDTKINERGLPLDVGLIKQTITIAQELTRRNRERVLEMTDGIAPTQRDKFLEWMNTELQGDGPGDNSGVFLETLQRKELEDLLKSEKDGMVLLPANVRELLELRIEGARVSIKKLLAMLAVVGADNRARGTLLYWGARTGRWAGRLIQPHNFPRGRYSKDEREIILDLLQHGDPDLLLTFFDKGMEALSNILRGFICAPDGRILYVVDYSQIEARILVWLAGQDDIVKMYFDKRDLYLWMASKIYGVPEEELIRLYKAKDPDVTFKRLVAKHTVLGCGFQMGASKFHGTCEGFGVDIEFALAENCVFMFRSSHPRVKALWYEVDNAAREVLRTGIPQRCAQGRLEFFIEGIFLRMRLPSGRCLSYPYPKLMFMEDGRENITYMVEEKKQWRREKTYGGKLVENAVQAMARDVMVNGMINAERAGYEVVSTVHDEIITEADENFGDVHAFEHIVCQLPAWAQGCPIAAEGYKAKRWRKQ